MTIKTRFCLDRPKDMFYIWVMLHMAEKETLSELATEMRIENNIAHIIHAAKDYDNVDSLIKEIAYTRYKEEKNFLENAVAQYQNAWDKINDSFYSSVQEHTTYSWQYSQYVVVVSPFHFGVSNRNDNFVIRGAYEDPLAQTRITAHEILMIQMWHMFETSFGKKELELAPEYYWSANEVTTTALLGLNPDLNILWHESKKGVDAFLIHYPQLSELKTTLQEIYLESKDFHAYLEKVRELRPS